jgi:hypothetical protein
MLPFFMVSPRRGGCKPAALLPFLRAGTIRPSRCYDGIALEFTTMTQLLQQALAQLQKLSPAEQDALAALILEEIADEQRWDEAFARSQGQLARLAAKVHADIAAGRVKDVGIDQL